MLTYPPAAALGGFTKRTWNFAWGGWRKVYGNAQRVSIGRMGIWYVNRHHHIYWRQSMRVKWRRYAGSLKDVSSGGHEVWGVNKHHHIYKTRGKGKWTRVKGHLHQVSCSQKDHVWGIWKHKIYRWTGKKWVRIAGGLKMVDVGPSGVWGVNKHNHIYHRFGTYGDINSNGKKVGLSYISP